MIILDTPATEGSTYVITGQFLDQDGVPVAPTSAAWTLMDVDGVVINARQDVAIPAATSYAIVLSGDDLPFGGGLSDRRRVLVAWTYDTTIGGVAHTGLAGRDMVGFVMQDLVDPA